MSVYLLNATIAHVRAQFTKKDAAEVRAYGGEFSAAELGQVSYACPAILITVLGWRRETQSKRLPGRGVRAVRMGAFVVYSHANREDRLAGAMALAERLALVLERWQPDPAGQPFEVAPLTEAEAPSCENLYGRAIDKAGQALWLVDWTQYIKPTVPPERLYELLAIDITDNTRRGDVPATASTAPAPIVVTEDVRFPSS